MFKMFCKLKKGFAYAYLAEYLLFLILIQFIGTNEINKTYNIDDEMLLTSLETKSFNFSSLIKSFDFSKFDALFSMSRNTTDMNRAPPPSYSILMNFQSDGTTSVQVLDLYSQITYYFDKGLCKHGQIFDPSINRCREVFCVDGFIFTSEGCKPDSNYNINSTITDTTTIPEELELEVTLMNKLCTPFETDCVKNSFMDSEEELITEFRKTLSGGLKINSTRIQNVTIISVDLKTYNSTFINITSLNSSSENYEIYSGGEFGDGDKFLLVNSTIEKIKISFVVLGNQMFPEDNEETLNYYYTLFRLNLDFYPFELFNKKVLIFNVTEVKTFKSWCGKPDEHHFIKSNFSLLASFDSNEKAKYYIYVNETTTLYPPGDYFLSIGIASRASINTNDNINYHDFDLFLLQTHASLNNFNAKDYTDVTNQLLGSSSDIIVDKLLTVCNRKPKIRIPCPDYETVRLSICELKAYQNRTYCYMEKCYYINEYEFDAEDPKHIRVCKFEDQNKNGTFNINKLKMSSSIPGYVSFVSNILSLTAMILTLTTFALFNELRNIPGWNCINLTIALTLAQFSFLIGSLAVSIPILCLITAVLTHYGFLAAFFNMNIIAFDLYRNFRSKSSHILINRINLKSRLLKYAAYAWFSPLLVVVICIIIDITTKSKSFTFKPCYASYFQDCSSSTSFSINILSKNTLQNETSCLTGSAPNNITSPIVQHCYIQNGKANLLFFGAPVAIIILVNAVFYVMTIYNIRQKRLKQKNIKIRRFSRVKCPGDNDVKFYIRMAVIMGFTWVIGFFLTTFSSGSDDFKIISEILIYAFILSNASMGVFIFFAFIFKAEVKDLYASLFKEKYGNMKFDGFFRRILENLKKIMCAACSARKPKHVMTTQ